MRLRSRRLRRRSPRVVARAIRDRLDLPAVWVAEEEADGNPVVVLLPLEAELVERAADGRLLLGRDPYGRVRPRPARLVHGDSGRAQVGHDRMALGLHDASAEDALVERGGCVGIGRLDGDVVDPWHAPPG